MISQELAQKLIERISKYTDYNVNIMDENGIIIASRDPERVGQYHEIAYRVVHGSEDVIDLTSSKAFPNVKPGINMVISEGGHREGVVGVTGDPEEIRSVAMIAKMAIETFLKYERQQDELRLRENRKERFVHMLTNDPGSDPAELREMADSLGYPEEMPRIPILVYSSQVDPDFVVRFMRGSELHRSTDISIVLDNHRAVIFKSIESRKIRQLSDFRSVVLEYLTPFFEWLAKNRKAAFFYVGTLQQMYPQYYYSFRHCKWLEKHYGASTSRAVGRTGETTSAAKVGEDCFFFFYDHVGVYLQEQVPARELQQVFHSLTEQIPEKKMSLFMDMTRALLLTNFNFNKASKLLFVHKNTLVYRYNAMKDYFGIDPLASASDRAFLGSVYQYYKNSHRE